MSKALARRRLLTVTAASSACLAMRADRLEPPRLRWSCSALGAEASLTFYDTSPARRDRLLRAVVAELDRLDAIFSLQRKDSALSRLNDDGRLADPPLDLVQVLEAAARVSALSRGAFDVTVQPIWRALAARAPAGTADLAAARSLVAWQAVAVRRAEIVLGRPGMALTLNGIAQGYITDRVADLLRDGGLAHVLVALGEHRGLGRHPDGSPWRIASPLGVHALDDHALAVSGPSPGPPLYAVRGPHLVDPIAGRPVDAPDVVVVRARSAMLADALSTALAVADLDRRDAILRALPALGAEAWSAGAARA